MFDEVIERREFLRLVLGGLAATAIDWSIFPTGPLANAGEYDFDAVIVGSGLGGLSCGAAFARQGFKPLVIEQHDRPGGYATSFQRPGGFEFDVSLHSTTIGERDGIHNLINGFPEIKEIEFVAHDPLYRSVFPDYDLSVPPRNLPAFVDALVGLFPGEEEGIRGLFADMQGFMDDFDGFMQAQNEIEMSDVPVKFPRLAKYSFSTWGQIVDSFVEDAKLKAIVSSLWGYFGLPPSKLASIYYAMPFMGYLREGGYYPKGRSQDISRAFVRFIEERGGTVLLKTAVDEIVVKNHAARGVKTKNGDLYTSRVVVSNANAHDTFRKMMNEEAYLADYLGKLDAYDVSLSSFQVFLGLKEDLVRKHGVTDSEIFYETSYDGDAAYNVMLAADIENCGFGLTLYDNLYEGYSPKGKNTVNIIALQGFDHWKPYEDAYKKGDKTEYNKEKTRMADILIRRVEGTFLPGLSDAIEVKEIGTPLTNLRYTRNTRGAIYGFDQTLNNSGPTRLGHKTPIQNLYLAGAWTRPGHGYSAVLWSGLSCFGEIMNEWTDSD
jgi:all-trans-retinol 13,14-reductase